MVIPVCWRNCWRSARSLPPSCSQKRSRTKGLFRLAASAASSLSSSASRCVAADHPSRSDGAATSAPAGQKQFGHRISCASRRAHSCSSWLITWRACAIPVLPMRQWGFHGVPKRPGSPRPSQIELQPLRAIDDVLQNQIVNGSIGVFIFGANVEQIAAGNAPGRSLRRAARCLATPAPARRTHGYVRQRHFAGSGLPPPLPAVAEGKNSSLRKIRPATLTLQTRITAHYSRF